MMKRPAATNILTVIVILLGAAGLLGGYVAFGQYAVSQQDRADDLRQVISEKNDIIAQKDELLAGLLDKYAALADDCEQAADCTTTAPTAEVIQQYIQGTPGATGEPGRPPTATEISDALRSYCSARDDCRGRDGSTGPAGRDGVDGQEGPQGPTGATGRGITDSQCVGEGDTSYWQITYTDGSSSTSPGPCRLAGGIITIP